MRPGPVPHRKQSAERAVPCGCGDAVGSADAEPPLPPCPTPADSTTATYLRTRPLGSCDRWIVPRTNECRSSTILDPLNPHKTLGISLSLRHMLTESAALCTQFVGSGNRNSILGIATRHLCRAMSSATPSISHPNKKLEKKVTPRTGHSC